MLIYLGFFIIKENLGMNMDGVDVLLIGIEMHVSNETKTTI